ncbi:MAG: hypothetical protein AAF702_37385 [Chloroflexota bacterium]
MRTFKLLSVIFVIDATLSVGFGAASWMFPLSTYGTIVDLSQNANPDSLIIAALSGQSVFYILIGLVCIFASQMPSPHSSRLALVMIARHTWVGLKGLSEVDREWIVGDPWVDIYIHILFVIAYMVAVAWKYKGLRLES